MRKTLFLLTLLVLAGMNLFSAQIGGTVVQAPDMTPMANATVVLASTWAEDIEFNTAQTQADGTFLFDNLDLGDYLLFVTNEDSLPLSRPAHVSIDDASQAVTDLEIIVRNGHNPPPPPQGIGTISGHIYDEQNQGIQGAEVSIVGRHIWADRLVLTAETDVDGFYEISDIPEGEYTVVANALDYFPGFYGTGEVPQSVAIDENNTDIQNINITLAEANNNQGTARISGIIKDIEGNPIHPATVGYYHPGGGHGGMHHEITNQADGTFSFDNLAFGAYNVYAEAEGYATYMVDCMFELTPEDPYMDDMEIVLPPEGAVQTGRIAGFVRDENGDPIEDARVRLNGMFPGPGNHHAMATDADGAFLFDNIPYGDYSLSVRAEGYMPYEVDTLIELNETSNYIDNIEIVLYPREQPGEGVIAGTVLDQNDEPVRRAMVNLYSTTDIEILFTQPTNRNGEFHFAGLPLSEYAVVVVDPMTWDTLDSTVVVLSQDNPQILDLELRINVNTPERIGSIGGQVIDGNNNAVLDLTVILMSRGHNFEMMEAVTDDNGNFLFEELFLGHYQVIVGDQGCWDTQPIMVEVELTEATPTVLDLVINYVAPIIPEAIGSLSGQVVDQDNAGIADAEVMLHNREAHDFKMVTTDASGNFSTDELFTGTYRIDVHAHGYYRPQDDELSVTITEADPNHTNFVISMQPHTAPEGIGTVRGIVKDDNNNLVSDALVVLRRGHNQWMSFETITNSDGAFEFTDVPEGRYFLLALGNTLSGYYEDDSEPIQIHITPDNALIEGIEIVLDGGENPGLGGTLEITLAVVPTEDNPAFVTLLSNEMYLYVDQIATEGTVTFEDLPEGNYYVNVMMPGYAPYFYNNATSIETANLVQVTDENTTSITADLSGFEMETYAVSGTVIDTQGNPVPRARIHASRPLLDDEPCNPGHHDLNRHAVTDDNGNYTLQLVEAEYIISAFSRDHMVTFWPGTHDFYEATPLEVESDLADINFVLSTEGQATYSIRGTVTIAGTAPDEPVMVVAVSSEEDEEEVRSAAQMVEDDGSYLIEFENSGRFYVVAITAGAFPEFYPNAFDWTDASSLEVDGDLENIDFDLTYPESDGVETLSGTVTDQDGEAVAGATVLLSDTRDMPVAFATTNADGNYSIAFVGAKDYTLKATKVYYHNYVSSINPAVTNTENPILRHLTTEKTDNKINPVALGLSNYPNPFNPITTIHYSVKSSGHVDLAIYNIKGQRILTLVNGSKEAGKHDVVWNGTDSANKSASSGIYFMRLESKNETVTKKITLMK